MKKNYWYLKKIIDQELKQVHADKKYLILQSMTCTVWKKHIEDPVESSNDMELLSGNRSILAELIPDYQSDEEEAADYSQILPQHMMIFLINILQDYVAIVPNVLDMHRN